MSRIQSYNEKARPQAFFGCKMKECYSGRKESVETFDSQIKIKLVKHRRAWEVSTVVKAFAKYGVHIKSY